MTCAWCRGPVVGRRRDARFCSVRCRQAAHRFSKGARSVVSRSLRDASAAAGPRRFAYADPPYPGKSGLYRGHRDFAGEVDHRELLERLVDEYPHGWALSTSAEALQRVLALCPPGVRVAAWVRGERPTSSYRPLSSWEPVIVAGGRPVLRAATGEERRIDSLVCGVAPRLTDPERVIGAKPAEFCYWVFDLLGAQPGDELDDLYPGSGGVARAWAEVNRLAQLEAGATDLARAALDA